MQFSERYLRILILEYHTRALFFVMCLRTILGIGLRILVSFRAGLTVPGQGLQFQGKAHSSRAGLTVPGQGLQFQGKAHSSRAGLTVPGHGDVP